MDRSAWLASRRTGLGGTDAAPVCGQSEWRTPLQVYDSKVSLDEQPQTDDMYRGILLEPAVRQMYCDATGLTVEKPAGIIRHQTCKFAIASLDGIADGRIVVDMKTARSRKGWGEPGTDEIPRDYLFQMQHYLAVTRLPIAELAVLFGNFEFAIYVVESDAEFQDMLMDREAAFWDRVLRRDPPEPVNAEDAKLRWPIAKPMTRPACATDIAAWERALEVRAAIKHLETIEQNCLSTIKMSMGDNEQVADGNDVLATWKNTKPSMRFDLEAFKTEQPEVYKNYLRQTGGGRRFLLKEPKGGYLDGPARQQRPGLDNEAERRTIEAIATG